MFLCVSFSVSASSSTLSALYNFDNTNHDITVAVDSVHGYNLHASPITSAYSKSGVLRNASGFGSSLNVANYSGVISDMSTSNAWSVNFWIYANTSATNSQIYFTIYSNNGNTALCRRYVATSPESISRFVCSVNNTVSLSNLTPQNLSSWNMITLTYDGVSNTLSYYLNSALVGFNNTVPNLGANATRIMIGDLTYMSVDEFSIYDGTLTQVEITSLYLYFEPSNTITVSTPLIAISYINTKLENGIVYVYPSIEGQTLIKGYYYIDNNFEPVYQTKICDLNVSVNMIDNFNSVTYLSDDGWSYAENMTTGIFDAVDFGLSLWFNTTLYLSDIYKSFTPTKSNLEVSYILKPQGTVIGASFDKSTDTFISVRSVAGGDITPIEFAYNGTVTGGNMCLYSYAPTRQLILCQAMSDTDWLNVTEYIDFKTSKTYTIKVSVNNIPATTKYSRPINFFSNEQDIGRIYIHPQFNATLGTSAPNQFIDNIAVINIGNTYAPLVLSDTTNITYTSWATCFLGLCTYSYTTLQNTGNHSFSAECDYSIPKCYTSRFYTYNTNASVYNNYEDFSVCSVASIEQIGNVIEGNPSTYNPNGVSIDGLPNISSTTKLLIVFFTVLFTIIGFITAGFTSHQEQLLIVTGLVFAVFELLIATIFKWIPSWIGITLLIVALFFMVIVGFLFKGNQGAG
jgi:hypothetical protein